MSTTVALYRLGRGSARRRRLVLAAWIFAAVALMLVMVAKPIFVDDLKIPGAESQEAADRLQERFPGAAGTSARIVFKAKTGQLSDPATAQAVAGALDRVKALDNVSHVDDPSATGMISADGTLGVAEVRYWKQAGELGQPAVTELTGAVKGARSPQLQVELAGPLVETTAHPEPGLSEALGLVAAMVILLVAFGSLVAMAVPIAIALLGLVVGLSLIAFLALFTTVPTVGPTLATMIGLGVGIDYSLFIVTRYRENLARGHAPEEAAGRAVATSGAAVVFAGGTVVVAILGLWVSGIQFIGMLGTASAIAVAVAVLAAITLLPALLGFAGRSIDRLRIRRVDAEPGDTSGWSARWARAVAARPWPFLIGSVAVLLLLASPVFAMRLGQVDSGVASQDTTKRRAYDLIAEGFGPGYNGPLLLTIDVPSYQPEESLRQIADTVRADRGIAAVLPPRISPDGSTALLTAIPTSAPRSDETTETVHRLRDDVLPRTVPAANVRVGGATATNIDLADRVSERLPWLIAAVIALSFVLLMAVFRSVLVPLKAAAMNLLSIGASYGVIVAVFQWGWGRSLLGVDDSVAIVSFVPMMVFAVTFGLSMDYEVFLLSRIREEHLSGRRNVDSVVTGLSSTARVITSAALIMIGVFMAFVSFDDVAVKMAGVGLATAVLVDATIVRIVLVPATMVLLGEANWWMPRTLGRFLPAIDIEGEPALEGVQ